MPLGLGMWMGNVAATSGGGGGGTQATWSAANSNAHMVLSNDNKTATDDGLGSGNQMVKALPGLDASTGSGYFIISGTGGNATLVGIANAAQATNDFVGGTTNSLGAWSAGGTFGHNSGVSTPTYDLNAGNTMKVRLGGGNIYFTKSGGAESAGTDVTGMGIIYPAYSTTGGGSNTATIDSTNWLG